MPADPLGRVLEGLPERRVLVVSDRYPPDAAGGAERSLHLMLREEPLRGLALVATFDKALAAPERRSVDGVEILALPAPAAWPLHRLSQFEVDALKRRPFGLKWATFLREVAHDLRADPVERARAFGVRFFGRPEGGVAMDHRTVAESGLEQAIARIVAHVKPDLVHADNARAILASAGALTDAGPPLIAVVRDHRFSTPNFRQTFDVAGEGGTAVADAFARRALAFRQERLRRADLVLVTSAHVEALVRAAAAPERVRRLALTPVEPAPVVAVPPEGFNVAVVGSLNANKGQAGLIEAWPEVLARRPDATLEIAGEGPDRAALAALIERLGVADRVRLLGPVEGVERDRLFGRSHVVALPTLWEEPFGRVAVEAGAAGRPVVAYAVGGHAETVVDGVTGRLAPAGDRAAFIDALLALGDDPEARVRFGEAGRKRAESYAPGPLAAGLADVWREVAGRAKTAF
ncbi:glycosyltransferase [Methylopila henanensis]|uniref:Glycosyltransferase n=1 Tax=Methylopila henanensis TaxID=873516 RepID=A0ABW4K259_9HYPH